MFAIELNASRACALDKRGTLSIASTLILRALSAAISASFCAGQIKLTSVAPSLSSGISLSSGAFTFRMISACHTVAVSTSSAPACSKAWSAKLACSPAPRSIITSKPSFFSLPTVSGVAATRRSFIHRSWGIPMCILFTFRVFNDKYGVNDRHQHNAPALNRYLYGNR